MKPASAQAGGGRLSQINTAEPDASPWMSAEGGDFQRREEKLDERWKDAGPFVLLLLLPLAMLAFRRGALFCLPLLLLGTGLMSGAVFGRIAGRSAAKEAMGGKARAVKKAAPKKAPAKKAAKPAKKAVKKK